jgi:peptide-methionine (S)-S-oxide reductase
MLRRFFFFIFLCIIVLAGSCQNIQNDEVSKATDGHEVNLVTRNESELSTAYFSSGCFWCVEAIYESIKGVEEAISGYSGGREPNPTYQSIGSHAETVKVIYDPKVLRFEQLVKAYYGSQDPTTIGQDPDYGVHYRSILYFQNEDEKKFLESYKAALNSSGKYSKPIITEIKKFEKFWEAEEYHQNYERLHPDQPYVRSVSRPRLEKFKKKFPELLK